MGGAGFAPAADHTISQIMSIFSNLTFCILNYQRCDAASASDCGCVAMWHCHTASMAIEM
jgi:hypothetical protein